MTLERLREKLAAVEHNARLFDQMATKAQSARERVQAARECAEYEATAARLRSEIAEFEVD